MVWLQAMVLGRLGRKPSPHPRACALSCPLLAIYGPGSLGHLTRPFALPHPDALSPLSALMPVAGRIIPDDSVIPFWSTWPYRGGGLVRIVYCVWHIP